MIVIKRAKRRIAASAEWIIVTHRGSQFLAEMLDFLAIVSTGSFPFPFISNHERAARAVTWGLRKTFLG